MYEIYENRTTPAPKITQHSNSNFYECSQLCNKNSLCNGFTLNRKHDCTLRQNVSSNNLRVDILSDVYINKPNPSYWWVWLLIFFVAIGILIILCRSRGSCRPKF